MKYPVVPQTEVNPFTCFFNKQIWLLINRGGIEWKSKKRKVDPIVGGSGGMPPEIFEIYMQICAIWCILEL